MTTSEERRERKKRRKEEKRIKKMKKKEKKRRKKEKRKKNRSRSRSEDKLAREERKRMDMDRKEYSRFDMDPNKEYNQDWNKNKKKIEDENEEGYEKIAPEQYVEIKNGIRYKVYKDQKRMIKLAENNSGAPIMIEIIVNDRMGNKTRVKCCPDDSVGDFKKLVSAHTGTRPAKIRLQRGHRIFKDHITLEDYEIKHGQSIDMYYN